MEGAATNTTQNIVKTIISVGRCEVKKLLISDKKNSPTSNKLKHPNKKRRRSQGPEDDEEDDEEDEEEEEEEEEEEGEYEEEDNNEGAN
jgi:hypothetical protein